MTSLADTRRGALDAIDRFVNAEPAGDDGDVAFLEQVARMISSRCRG